MLCMSSAVIPVAPTLQGYGLSPLTWSMDKHLRVHYRDAIGEHQLGCCSCIELLAHLLLWIAACT